MGLVGLLLFPLLLGVLLLHSLALLQGVGVGVRARVIGVRVRVIG